MGQDITVDGMLPRVVKTNSQFTPKIAHSMEVGNIQNFQNMFPTLKIGGGGCVLTSTHRSETCQKNPKKWQNAQSWHIMNVPERNMLGYPRTTLPPPTWSGLLSWYPPVWKMGLNAPRKPFSHHPFLFAGTNYKRREEHSIKF